MFNPRNPFDPAVDVMKHYAANGRDAEFVSLKHYNIKELAPLMAQLQTLVNMKALLLTDNEISGLPEDMSSLKSLETLDLSRNPIQSASRVMRGLKSLPKLKHLWVNLPEEEEDVLVATLTRLETLNGISLHGSGQEPFSPINVVKREHGDDIVRGYSLAATSFDPRAQLKYTVWGDQHTSPFVQTQQLVQKVSGPLTNPQEFSDLVELVNAHVNARTRFEPDVIKSAIHQFHAKSLLLEYSFDELTRVCGKVSAEVAQAVESIYKQHLELIAAASTIFTTIQTDRDQKLLALQEDLTKQVLQRERELRAKETPVQGNRSVPPAEPSAAFTRAGDAAMTLNELRAFIQHLFRSKLEHDTANAAAQLPPETVEQHLYTFMYARTNSDDDVKRRVSRVFRSVKALCRENLDIEVFSMILKNEVEEQYWSTFHSQKAAVLEAVAKQRPRTNTRGDLFLTEDQARQVILALAPNSKSEKFVKIQQLIARALIRDESQVDSYLISPEALGNEILRYYVSAHVVSIRPIVSAFHRFDANRAGVIDASQFLAMASEVFPNVTHSTTLQQLSHIADPYCNNVVTLSDAIRALGSVADVARRPFGVPEVKAQSYISGSLGASDVAEEMMSRARALTSTTYSELNPPSKPASDMEEPRNASDRPNVETESPGEEN
jgi:hypothetical protein